MSEYGLYVTYDPELAERKLKYFATDPPADVVAKLARFLEPGTEPEIRFLAALEYALTTFTSVDHDKEFRGLILRIIKEFPRAGYPTVELLLLLTRGVFWAGDDSKPQAWESVEANNAIKNITQRSGRSYVGVERAVQSSQGGEIDRLAHSIINSSQAYIKPLGKSGVNSSFKATFNPPGSAPVDTVFKSFEGSRPVIDMYYQVNPLDFRRFIHPPGHPISTT